MTKPNGLHSAVTRKMVRHRARYERATGNVAALEDERAELYEEARRLDPPMTFREIAAVYGITEAAVMQKIRRREKAAAK